MLVDGGRAAYRRARLHLAEHSPRPMTEPSCAACALATDVSALFEMTVAFRKRAERAEAEATWEKKEHDKARDEWLNMRERLNGLHGDVRDALDHTRPPDDWRGNMCHYGGENDPIGEPYSWLATLIAEALDDHPAALTYDDEATLALPKEPTS